MAIFFEIYMKCKNLSFYLAHVFLQKKKYIYKRSLWFDLTASFGQLYLCNHATYTHWPFHGQVAV